MSLLEEADGAREGLLIVCVEGFDSCPVEEEGSLGEQCTVGGMESIVFALITCRSVA